MVRWKAAKIDDVEDGTDITALIRASRDGSGEASDQLFKLVYAELRRIARRSRYVGNHGDTMQPTVLANEAYVMLARRLTLPSNSDAIDRDEFFKTVGRAMRTILRDYWRGKNAEKRGGGEKPITFEDQVPAASNASDFDAIDYMALDEAMNGLEKYNKRWYEVVMHRHFAGCSIEETADMLKVGVSTVKSDWQLARAWLRREINQGG